MSLLAYRFKRSRQHHHNITRFTSSYDSIHGMIRTQSGSARPIFYCSSTCRVRWRAAAESGARARSAEGYSAPADGGGAAPEVMYFGAAAERPWPPRVPGGNPSSTSCDDSGTRS